MLFVLQLALFSAFLAKCAAPHVLICGGTSLGGTGGRGALRYDGRCNFVLQRSSVTLTGAPIRCSLTALRGSQECSDE